ncbi:MAG: hypothetical protein EDR02_01995 [Actinobacteria bacterium]|nr:MAG: hypothetical protein EDR02_01995 [Actinomycetota bacterium]
MRARLLTAVLTVAAVLMAITPARADERPGGGAYVSPGGDPTAVATDSGSAGGGEGGSGGSAGYDPCEWHVVIEDDFQFAIYDTNRNRQYSATGRWLERRCPGLGAVSVGGYFLVPEGGLVDPYQLAVDALASVSIDPPSIRTNPSQDGRLYVQVPTWLWLEPSWWQTYEATADAGRVWSSVRATPVTTTWSLGDGNTISCGGPGTAWRPGLSEDASDCTHTYRISSATTPAGSFDLEATVTFEVSWASNATGGGTLPEITRSSALDVEVGEIQAIGTRGGGS